jgi:hypothetical protein
VTAALNLLEYALVIGWLAVICGIGWWFLG